ncbi:MAG: GTP-dependent dephospho-CoA kinase family protein [Candidatus Bathyarchaeia archaeon]
MGTYILTPDLRDELKKPLGLLIRGNIKEVTEAIGRIINDYKPSKVITVGDIISKSLLERGLRVDVFIIDNRSMRKPIERMNYRANKILNLSNPAGMITRDSWLVIGEAISSDGPVEVLVEGEEDLLTIVAVLLAPEGSMVVYGQPNEGAVVISVNKESKEKMHKIVERTEYKRDIHEENNLDYMGV